MTFLPNSTFYWIIRGFHRTFTTGVVCRQGTLTPPVSWFRPILDLHMLYMLRPIFIPNLSLFFRTMLFDYPSVLFWFWFVALWSCKNNKRKKVNCYRTIMTMLCKTGFLLLLSFYKSHNSLTLFRNEEKSYASIKINFEIFSFDVTDKTFKEEITLILHLIWITNPRFLDLHRYMYMHTL